MTYAVWQPVPPSEDLRSLSDSERKIFFDGRVSRALWNLKSMQAALVGDPPLKVLFTLRAQEQMLEQLAWSGKDARAFLAALTPMSYSGSEWCYSPGHSIPHACDTYVMGFNRHTGKENPHFQPWVYVKFGFIGPEFKKLAVFSAHPEGQYREEIK